jgi:hypothetical protein
MNHLFTGKRLSGWRQITDGRTGGTLETFFNVLAAGLFDIPNKLKIGVDPNRFSHPNTPFDSNTGLKLTGLNNPIFRNRK